MATRSTLGGHPSNPDRTDVEYALVAGLYAALSLAPAAALALSIPLTSAATLYAGFLGALVSLTALVGRFTIRHPDLAVRLGRRDVSWLLVVVPAGWFLGAFGADAVGLDLPSFVVVLSVLAAGVGMPLGALLVAMSRTRHAAAELAGADEYARWEARSPRRWRRVALGVVVASFVVAALDIVAAIVFGVGWVLDLYYPLLLVLPLSVTLFNPRTIRVTDAGLVVENPVTRSLRSWSAVEDYTLTDTTLVVGFGAPWRPTLRCDRTDIEDVPAAVTALDRALAESTR